MQILLFLRRQFRPDRFEAAEDLAGVRPPRIHLAQYLQFTLPFGGLGFRLAVLTGDLDRAALQKALGLADRKSFRQLYLQPALKAGLIELTRPDAPNSRFQQYRLTARGRAARGPV